MEVDIAGLNNVMSFLGLGFYKMKINLTLNGPREDIF